MDQTLYRRPLPADAIAFSSPEGRQVFGEALATGGLTGYFPLAEQFHTQSDPAFCGLGSLVVALNALGIDPGRLWKGPWRWFSEELLDCCVPLDLVRERGLDLDELSCLARCNGAEVEVKRADGSDLVAWRAALTAGARGEIVVVASYDRAAMGQTGSGHFSPVAGYHEARDLVLVLDVARFKYPPHWVSAERLWQAMQSVDPVTERARGWMALRRRSHGIALGFSVRCDGESWQGLAHRLTSVVANLDSAEDIAGLSRAVLPLTSHLELRTPSAALHQEALIVGLTAPVGVARADDRAGQVDGRAHFRRGVDFFKEGDFRTALIEFRRAYELAPNYKVLYNLGQTSLELQDYAAALRSFERYLADGGKDVPAARRSQIEGDIEKLRKRVAQVEVTTNVPDAEIFIDDLSVGRTPLPAPLVVSAGRRKVSALKGGVTSSRVVDVAGGDSTSISLEIVDPTSMGSGPPVPAPTRTPDPTRVPARTPEIIRSSDVPSSAAPPSAAKSSKNPALWIGITLTGGLAAGTVATGILTLKAKKDFDNAVDRYGVDAHTVSDARSKTQTLALVTDILGGATILAGGITVVSVLLSGSSSKEQAKAFDLAVTPGAVVASGSF